jgi:DNA-binding transcriptional MocR family regulator
MITRVADLAGIRLDPSSDTPLYKQLAEEIGDLISRQVLRPGDRLPPTRELAGQLGLNRTTVSAAYAALDQRGLIDGQVGRGSFVSTPRYAAAVDSKRLRGGDSAASAEVSFASSRPATSDFPLEQFRRLTKEVVDAPDAAEILQLGSARGYVPLRRYLMEKATATGLARAGDDLMITSGCQQALDLIARVFAGPGNSVAVEDPVYHGMLRIFARAGADIFGVPVDHAGIDPAALEMVLERHRPQLLAVTPSFQNPTGLTLPLERRQRIVALAEHFGCILVEIDIYSPLRYAGRALPTLKELGRAGNTLLLRSYSKVSFPGLRVGWIIGPQPLIARLAEAKEISDLHSDQLSQAVLLRFAQSGELDRHLQRTRETGGQRLEAVLAACERHLPADAYWTRPEGGMNLWVELPPPLTADALLRRTQARGVSFLPGRHFATRDSHSRSLRICFGGLSPQQIWQGMQTLGESAAAELSLLLSASEQEPLAALV